MGAVAGVLIAALIIVSSMIHLWPVITTMGSPQAAFLGALVGAGGGLLAILAGALYNAKLNRDENYRLRKEEARALAISLRGEIMGIIESYERNIDGCAEIQEEIRNKNIPVPPNRIASFPAQPPINTLIFSNVSSRLGLLEDANIIADVAQFYGALPDSSVHSDVRSSEFFEFLSERIEFGKTVIGRAKDLSNKLETLETKYS